MEHIYDQFQQAQCDADAEDLADDLIKQFGKYNVRIGLSNIHALSDRAIMEVKLKGNTRETHLRANMTDVKKKLKLPILCVQSYQYRLFIIASRKEIVYDHLPKLLRMGAYKKANQRMLLPCLVGHNVVGSLTFMDLSEQPHLLLGGSSNSGKSVGLQAAISSISYGVSPETVNFVLVDLGANDLMPFEDLPHLACPVVRSQDVAFQALKALVVEMERRKDLELTNKQEFDALPRLVLVVDEFPALFHYVENKRISNSLRDMISSLLRRGRHGKIHVVLAAQNPTYQNMKVDLGNITARIAFQCAKKNFSEVILGEGGAERLSESGDLLLKATNFSGLQQIRGAYATPEELKQLVQTIAAKWRGKRADRFAIDIHNGEGEFSPNYGKVVVQTPPDDRLLATVMLWAVGRKVVSVNQIQRNFKIGWNKAAELVNQLESMGLVGQPISKLPRCVTPFSFEDIPADMLGFLQRNGVTDEAVKLAISARDSKTTELATERLYKVRQYPIEKTPAATQNFLWDNGPSVEHAKARSTTSSKYKFRARKRELPPQEINRILERLGSDRNKRQKI